MGDHHKDKEYYVSLFLQIIRFGIVGVFNNLIFLVVYYIVVSINEKLYLFGNVLGFLVSTLNAYLLNSRFVFNEKKKNKTQRGSFYKTYAIYTLSLGISTGLLYLFVDIISISEKIAPIISLMVTVPLNFVLNKFWVYRKKS